MLCPIMFQCLPCLDEERGRCADLHMRCSAATRVCICVDGYKLDESGTRCVSDTVSVSEIDCETIADCARLPNSRCNERHSECMNYNSNCCRITVLVDGFNSS